MYRASREDCECFQCKEMMNVWVMTIKITLIRSFTYNVKISHCIPQICTVIMWQLRQKPKCHIFISCPCLCVYHELLPCHPSSGTKTDGEHSLKNCVALTQMTREAQRTSYWQMNALTQKWHTSFLLTNLWSAALIWPCPTTEDQEMQRTMCPVVEQYKDYPSLLDSRAPEQS